MVVLCDFLLLRVFSTGLHGLSWAVMGLRGILWDFVVMALSTAFVCFRDSFDGSIVHFHVTFMINHGFS